uniref:Uncharacterized protein n=1 Tax=Zea mays TaxID=4577 RepID=A0A804PH23_MAIZE
MALVCLEVLPVILQTMIPPYDNVRTNQKGEFWVAIHCRRSMYPRLMSCHVKLRKFLLSFPIPAKYHYLMHIDSKLYALIIRDSPMARCFTSWRTARERW